MRTPEPVPEPLRCGPFGVHVGVDWVSHRQLRGPSYERMTRGVYTVAGGPAGHEQLIRAMRAVLPPRAVLGGLSAAWALGVFSARADDPVEVIMHPDQRVRSRARLVVRGDVLEPDEVFQSPFGLITSGARTAFDLARRLTWPASRADALLKRGVGEVTKGLPESTIVQLCRAVALVDAVLRATGQTVAQVEDLARRHAAARGSRVARIVLALADPRAESPPESVLRTRIVLRGLPRPTPQYVVRAPDGKFVARVDLAWEELKLAAEYDGSHHNERGQFIADRARDNRLSLTGWRAIHLDAAHLNAPADLLRLLTHVIFLRRQELRADARE